MKKRLYKTTAILIAVVISLVVSAYVASAQVTFFTASNGTGITKGIVNGEPFYTAFGENGRYTSVDGKNFIKRPIEDVEKTDSIVYGKNMGIAVTGGELTASLYDRDMTYAGEVYSYAADGESEYFIYLIPEIYYDSYSGLFFCHGYNNAAKDFDVYYTDGTIAERTYGTNPVKALIWNKTTGDFFDMHSWDYNGTDDSVTLDLDYCKNMTRYITGNEKGYVFALYGNDLNKRCAGQAGDECPCGINDARRAGSLFKTTKHGDVYGAHLHTKTTGLSRCTAVTENNVALFQSSQYPDRLYRIDLESIDFETETILDFASTNGVLTEAAALVFALENDVYYSSASTNNIYKISMTREGDSVTYTAGGNIHSSANYGTDTTSWSIKDAEPVDEDNVLLLINTGSGARIYEADMSTGALSSASCEEMYVNITGGTDTLVISKGSAVPHSLMLEIGSEEPTADKMLYTHSDSAEAKYMLDLDGVDVNGIYAWTDALEGDCTFSLTAKSADYPSVMKTVEITVTVEE